MQQTIDWPDVIKKLQASGRSQHQIAAAIGVDQSTVCRMGDGRSEPRYSMGQQLLAMLAEAQQPTEPASAPGDEPA